MSIVQNAGGEPLVDVVMPTYNHARFLIEAIESVLMQKTLFRYRLNIADDCSTDSSRLIIQDYALKYSSKIRLVLPTHHIGVLNKDRLSIRALQLCSAKYLSLLEGDDYWTDPYKLQKQVDFLESRPDFVMCGHNALVIDEEHPTMPGHNVFPPDHKTNPTIEDLLFENVLPTCSLVFRREALPNFPEWFFQLRNGDWLLNVMNAQHGRIQYFEDVMAVYRKHDNGLWSSGKPVDQHLEIVKGLDALDAYLGFKYKRQVRAAKARRYYEIAQQYYWQGDRRQGRSYVLKYCGYAPHRACRKLINMFLNKLAGNRAHY